MNRKVTVRLLRTLRPYTAYLILSTVLSVGYVISSLFIPILVGNAIDAIVEIGNVNFSLLETIFIQIAISLVFASLCQYGATLCNNRLAYGVTKTLRDRTFKKIQQLPLSYLDAHPYGDVVSRMISDIDTLSDGLLLGFSQVFTGIVSIVVTLIFMFSMNWIMALVVVVLTPISLFVARFIAKRIHRYFEMQTVLRGKQTAYIEEMVSGQKIVRAFNYERKSEEKFAFIAGDLEDASLKANFYSSLVNPSTRFVNALVYAVIAFIGAMMVISQPAFTPGKLTTFLSYASQYTKPFNDISSVVTELQNAMTCADRVFELLDQEDEPADISSAVDLKNVRGRVSLEHVFFSYEKDQRLIEDFNLNIIPGQKVAIVGPTGCGKTTLINLLMRFYDVTSGEIRIDHIGLKDLKRNSIRDNYGMVLQETWLRHGTIRENILLGRACTDDEIQTALKQSHADYFVSRLPDGVDTVIDESGGQLSQGQKQLLCIARVMIHLPPMLILDEATSSIDTRTEVKIQDAFSKMMKGRTSFIVAHRLSTIREADVILVMNEGHIIEQGSHEELLARKGFYYNLYNAQFDH